MRICPQSLAQYVDYFIMFNTNIYLSISIIGNYCIGNCHVKKRGGKEEPVQNIDWLMQQEKGCELR